VKIWHNARLTEQLTLPAVQAAWLTGDGAFETIRTYHSKPFALGLHLQRLQISLAKLGITGPAETELSTAVNAVIEANEPTDNGRLRVTVFSDGQYLVTHQLYEPDHGSVSLARNPETKFSAYTLSDVKSVSYAENFRALRLAQKRGFTDTVFFNEKKHLVESALANVIWLSEGTWYTPTLSSGCLPGITRQLLIENFGLQESDLAESAISAVEGLALVSSLREIVQVERYESKFYPSSKSLTQLQSSFHSWIRSKLCL
jgi:branched-chain amino acid aminotransferase